MVNTNEDIKAVNSYGKVAGSELVTTIYIGLSLTVLFLILYEVLRKVFKRNYEYRIVLSGYPDMVDVNGKPIWVPEKQPGNMPFSWIPAVYSVREADIARHISVDAAMFLRFYKSGMYLFFVLSVLTCVVLLPTYAVGNYKNLDPLDPLYINGILIITMSNVQRGSPIFWVTFIVDVFVMMAAYAVYYYDFRKYAWYARMAMASRTPSNFAVLVSDIPDRLRNKEEIFNLFDRVYPDQIAEIYLYTDRRYLDRMKMMYTKALTLKEKAMWKYVRNNKKLKGQRPTHKVKSIVYEAIPEENVAAESNDKVAVENGADSLENGTIPNKKSSIQPKKLKKKNVVEVVDSIDYWAKEQERLWCEIQREQQEPDPSKGETTGGAIVVFRTMHTAAMARQTQLWYRKSEVNVWRAPEPAAIRWWKFRVPYSTKAPMSVLTFVLIFAVIIAWSPLSLIISAFTNLAALSTVPGFEWVEPILEWPPFILNVIQGILPPLLLSILSVLASLLFRLIITRGRHFHQELVEDRLRTYYFIFLAFANFLYILIGGSIVSELGTILQDFNVWVQALAQGIPSQSVFFLNYVFYSSFVSFPQLFSQWIRIFQRGWVSYGLFIFPKTEREWRRIHAGMSSFFLYFKFYALGMLMNLIAMVYSTVAPLICVFVSFYFFIAYWVCKHNICYTQYNTFSAKGYYFNGVFWANFVSLYVKQIFMIILFSLNAAPIQAALEVVFFFTSLFVAAAIYRKFFRLSANGSITTIFDGYGKTIGKEDEVAARYITAYIPPSMKKLENPKDLSGLTIEEASEFGIDLELANNVEDPDYGKVLGEEHEMSKKQEQIIAQAEIIDETKYPLGIDRDGVNDTLEHITDTLEGAEKAEFGKDPGH